MVGGVSVAGFRPGFGLGGTIHCLFVSEVGVDTVTDWTWGKPLVDNGARGARALGVASEADDAVLGDADIVTTDRKSLTCSQTPIKALGYVAI